jgi:hypothetical protein
MKTALIKGLVDKERGAAPFAELLVVLATGLRVGQAGG